MRIVVVTAVLLLASCSTSTTAPPGPETIRSSVPPVAQVGPLVIADARAIADKQSANPDCASVVRRVLTPTGDYAAAALKPGCTATEDTPQNGDHGFYPTPPARARTEQVATPVGPATLFSNQYSECTSSCYMGTDEVALVSVDGTVVQITAVTSPASGTTERRRADLVALLLTLRRA